MTFRDLTPALLDEAKTLHTARRFQEAQRLYQKVLDLAPSNFDATHLMGVMALQIGQPRQAVTLLTRAVELDPKHLQAHVNLGTAYWLVDQLEEAVRLYDRAIEIDPVFAGSFRNRGAVLQRLGRHDEAAESFQRVCELAPGVDFALGSLFESRRYACDWRDFEQNTARILSGVAAGRLVDRPFSFLSVCASPEQQLRNAQINAAHLCPRGEAPLWRGERYSHGKIRIAYVSADYRDHVVLRLITPILELHDRERFDTVGVSLVSEDGSAILARAKRALGQFIDASRLSDAMAASTMRELEVDIAIDLTGYTAGSRLGIFAHRPAPVQVNLFGFPGTMGTSFMDYIIADEFVIPDGSNGFFSEKVVRLPDTFQINGQRDTLSAEPPTPSRREAGLPESGVVFCAFNNSYKLNPGCFDIWSRVLRAVPDSVLWLLGEGSAVQRHLRDEAGARGVPPERLVFAPRVGYAHHLVRLRLADLFLDTLPFNAGATAGDALWSGLPILTCAGQAFAARMAGSVLRAAGLPELITFGPEEYEKKAIELGGNREQLAAFKVRLATNKSAQPLFDMERYCRHLESAYVEMWERTQRGDATAGFIVPPIDR